MKKKCVKPPNDQRKPSLNWITQLISYQNAIINANMLDNTLNMNIEMKVAV